MMEFATRQLSLYNLVGFTIEQEPQVMFFERLFDDYEQFKGQMNNNDFYSDGPIYYIYHPNMKTEDILVFTSVGNKVEVIGENISDIFFQESLDFTTDFYYRHSHLNEPIPYEKIEKSLSDKGMKLINIFHVVLGNQKDYVIDLYCEVEINI